MRLFSKRTTAKPGEVIDGKYVPDAAPTTTRPSWMGVVFRILVVLLIILVIFLVFLFIRGWLNSSGSRTDKGVSTTENSPVSAKDVGYGGDDNQIKQPSGSTSTPSLSNGTSSSSASSSGKFSSSSSTKSKPSTASNQNLSNSGPGDVAAIFVATTALAAFGHNLALRRKYA